MSVEALAMAGVDYMECYAINHGALLEQSFKQLKPKVESDRSLSPEGDKSHSTSLNLDIGMEWLKKKMREWATAVASNNEAEANLRVSEISLIMDNHLTRGK
ncbi:hypothetical protein VNO77_43939 [Canavalia gladiata]|uniref:Uncharacterized protein n=1 Tax=Canavalia gladiata TaxID=3824 RepID=A0AAN9JV51_CANGL